MSSDARIPLRRILHQLWRDLRDDVGRMNLVYWLIWQIPGATGDLLRSRYLVPKMREAGTRVRIMAGSRFESIDRITVGDNVRIGFNNYFQARGGLKIGDNVLFAPQVTIWTSDVETSDPQTPIREQGHVYNPVVIEDDVFVASNAYIHPGTTLSRGCVVSAGAVVTGKHYHPFSILGGNPARVIGYRGDRRPEGAGSSPALKDQSPKRQVHLGPGQTSAV